MNGTSYAIPLLALGLVGLIGTCLAANAPDPETGLAAAETGAHALVMRGAPAKVEPLPVAPPAPVPEARLAVPPISPAIATEAKAETCQAEFDKIVSANPISFMSSGARLTPAGKETLGELAVIARACSGMNIEIQGHTDKTGSRRSNIRLSKQRADTVKEYLVEIGLSPDLMTAVGFGPDQPIASNRTEKGRAKNRRIEFRVSRGE
jgi:outer membrane protein OmpA-like peptidoglycan-associated protein